MVFNENVKKQVKEAAAFRCCRCQSLSVEIHHIIPQEHGGSDEMENAAPLCPNCHSDFDDNPKKRKEIKQMRDWWYRQASNLYRDGASVAELQEINHKLEMIESRRTTDLSDIKSELKKISNKMIDNITEGTVSVTASGILNASAASLSPSVSPSPSFSPDQLVVSTKLGDGVHANVRCYNCNTSIGLLVGSNRCPNCQTELA